MMYNYEITRTIGSGNNQKALNKARVEAIKVPLTCVAEQKELIDKIKPALEFIQNVKDELRAAETRKHFKVAWCNVLRSCLCKLTALC